MANTLKIGIAAQDEGFKQSLTQMADAASKFSREIGASGKGVQSLNGSFRTAKKAVMDLALAYNQLSDEAKQSDFGVQLKAQLDTAKQAAAELLDLKGDISNELSNMASDTASWDAASQGIGVLSSGLQGLASAYGLVGGDCREFQQALVAVNAIQSISNTIVGIGNALQAESALMTGLRTLKTKLLTTSIIGKTTAEKADAVATGVATKAQIANNLAVLANPYVLAAAAIAALVAGIVYWVSSLNEATDAEIANAAAVDAFNEAADSEMKKVGEQIDLYNDLKAQYDSAGAKTDEFAQKIVNNTELQKKLGITTKTVADVHRFFANDAGKYIQACIARGSAMAAEAAQAALLGQTLAELSRIQAKLMAGEEVNWRDMRKVVEAAGYSSEAADKLMKAAGYVYEGEGMAYGNIQKGTGDIVKLIQEMQKGGAYKALQDMSTEFIKTFDTINEIDFNGMLTANFDKMSDGAKKASGAGKKAGKETKQQIEKVLTSLEGCDAIIQEAQKDMKKLKSTSATYAADMEKLKNTILVAKAAKLKLIDTSTLKGLYDSKKLITDIISDLPVGHKSIEEYKKQLKEVDEQILSTLEKMSESGDIEALEETKKQLEAIIKTIPLDSKEMDTFISKWQTVNKKIIDSKQTLDNLLNDVAKGSVTWLKQQISEIDKQLANLDPNSEHYVTARASLEIDRQNFEFEINRIERDYDEAVLIKANVIPVLSKTYKMTAYEQMQAEMDRLEKKKDELDKKLEKPTSREEYNSLNQQISKVTASMTRLQKAMDLQEVTDDIKNYKKEIADMSYDSIKNGIQGLGQMYDSISGLADKLSECEDPLEGIFAVFDTIFGVVDTIKSFIEGIEQLTETFNMLRGAKDALTASTAKNTAVTQLNTSTTESAAAAQSTKAAADSQEAGAALGNALANTAEAGSKAASQMSSMGPFGWIAGIAAAIAITGALFGIISQAKGFATGGIVEGSTTMGDSILVRANRGEMILNNRQQSKLFDMINNGNVSGSNVNVTGDIKVRGSDLLLALRNNKKITGKTL